MFDRTPHTRKNVEQWSRARGEFVKRAGFALLWSLTVHDKEALNRPLSDSLKLIESEACDDRNLVKKGANMALRAVGKRNRALNGAAIKTAKRLARSGDASAQWIGSHALRELTGSVVQKRLDSLKS